MEVRYHRHARPAARTHPVPASRRIDSLRGQEWTLGDGGGAPIRRRHMLKPASRLVRHMGDGRRTRGERRLSATDAPRGAYQGAGNTRLSRPREFSWGSSRTSADATKPDTYLMRCTPAEDGCQGSAGLQRFALFGSCGRADSIAQYPKRSTRFRARTAEPAGGVRGGIRG